MKVPDGEHEDHGRARLVREPEPQRHGPQQRPPRAPSAQDDRTSTAADLAAAPSPAPRARCRGVPQSSERERVGRHAVVELHRRDVLEDVEPPRRERAEPGRHEASVHQWPCVVGEARLEACRALPARPAAAPKQRGGAPRAALLAAATGRTRARRAAPGSGTARGAAPAGSG